MAERACQHFALAPESFALHHVKPGLNQPAAHKACRGECRERTAGAGEARHRSKQAWRPHFRVFRRRETIQKPGVYLAVMRVIQRIDQFVDIAKPEIERHASAIQHQPLTARQRHRPLCLELLRPRREFRPVGVCAFKIGRRQREFFKTDEVQALQRSVRVRVAKRRERLPERQEIQPGAKSAFGDNKAVTRVCHKAFRELITVQKDIAGLFQTVIIGKINVIKISGNRCTLIIKRQAGGLYGDRFHVNGSNDRQSHDLSEPGQTSQISCQSG